MTEPKIIEGGVAVDDRGSLTFSNDFDMSEVKRFYMVENFDNNIVRAYHGHLKEAKYVFVPQGSVLIILVKMNGKKIEGKPVKFFLSSRKPQVLFVPPSYANGFKALEDNTKIMFFSTSTLQESRGDDYRFEWDLFGEDIWKAENR